MTRLAIDEPYKLSGSGLVLFDYIMFTDIGRKGVLWEISRGGHTESCWSADILYLTCHKVMISDRSQGPGEDR